MRTPLRRSIAQVLKIARAGGRSLRQRIWSDAYRCRRSITPGWTAALSRRPSQAALSAWLMKSG